MKKLERDLENLKHRIAEMGDLAQSMVEETVLALTDSKNDEHHRKVLADEERLDQMQLDVDKETIRLLTVYGPVAGNLRLVISAVRINSQLERIGDQTVNMYGHIQLLTSHSDKPVLAQFEGMSKLVRTMLYETLKAFRLDDAVRARATMANDDLVDVLNDEIIRELIDTASDSGDPTVDVAIGVAQIMISQALERIADQACNVCEQIIYMVEGTDVRHLAR